MLLIQTTNISIYEKKVSKRDRKINETKRNETEAKLLTFFFIQYMIFLLI